LQKSLESDRYSLGDGVGLGFVATAARLAGGDAWLSAYTHPETGQAHTVFHVTQLVRVLYIYIYI